MVPTIELVVVAVLVLAAVVLTVVLADTWALTRTSDPEELSDLALSVRPLRAEILSLRPPGGSSYTLMIITFVALGK